MAEEGSLPIDHKNLHDLRVVDLKKELEKRGLSKSGSKKDLVDRLKTQLKIEELREKSKSTPEGVSAQAPSIQLSEGGHNEIVKNYLQQREKLYEQQMEQKKKYQEEASRSQESESQSETDDGASSQLKSEKQEQVGTSKLSDIEEDEPDSKTEDAEAEESPAAAATAAADEGKVNDEKSTTKEDAMDETPAETLDKKGERRSRSRSGSTRSRSSSVASSRSAERSPIISRPKPDEKSSEVIAAGPTKPLSQRVARSRSPSVEEVRSGSSSPEGRSPKAAAAQPPRAAQRSQSPPAKKIRRSRSASSSGTESPAEDQQKPRITQKKQRSRDSTGSESSQRSSPRGRSKGSRSRSSSSSGSSASPPRKRVPSGELLQQLRKKSRSLSSSESEEEEVVESRGRPQRKSRSRSRSPMDDDEEAAPAGKVEPDLKKLPADEKASVLKSADGENVTTDSGKNSELKQLPAPAEGKGGGDAAELIQDRTELTVESITLLDQVTLSQSQLDNDGKGEEMDVKPTRKRRWGSTTLKTITCQPSINISTESLKAMIPEMKGSVLLPELLPELDNPSPEPQNHQGAASQTKTGEAVEGEEEEEGEVVAGALGAVPDDGAAVKRQVSFKSQDSVKQKNQESAKLKRTIFQVVKADDEEYEETEEEEDQEVNKSSEKVDTEEIVPEAETLTESNGRKVVDTTKGVVEQDKKVDTSKEVRRISRLQVPAIPVDDPQPVGRRSPSPAKNLATNIVHIHRLVRPYTLGQLKELLSQTGVMVDDGFWIDKIKSHCLVVYTSVDEAVATRRALHGKRWPISNPNVLRVEYSTQELFDMFKNAKDGVLPKPLLKPEELPEKKREERPRPLMDHPPRDAAAAAARDPERKEVAKPAARESARPRGAKERSPPVREWDRDKVRQSRSRSRDRNRKEEKTVGRGVPGAREREREARDASREERRKRRASSQERKEKKAEKVEAEPPAKLLDDLFRKTKAMPCIYWLPLTEEQIAQKVANQQQIDAERELKRQEREQMQMQEEREQKVAAATRARDDRIARENKRDDRRPDRRDRSTDAKPREPDDGGVKRGGPPSGGGGGMSGSRIDRPAPRR